MKKLLLLTFLLSIVISIQGQISITEFPEDLQFYGRNLQTNKAQVPIKGTCDIGDDIRILILADGVLYKDTIFTTTSTNFEAYPDIEANLVQYTIEVFELVAPGVQTSLAKTEDVVAGDVYIITGQSNAEAKMFNGSAAENNSAFIRVFGLGTEFSSTLLANLEWFIGQGDGSRQTNGNTGQWGLRLAKQIVDNQAVPVCIFNGARGGWPIINFLKNDADPEDLSTNYGRLLYRLNQSKLLNKVRAVFWYQGESDSNSTSPAIYKQRFNDLYQDWASDFTSLEKTYITQIRKGCGRTQYQSVYIQDALRQLAEELPNTNIMSAKGLIHDGCHFPYQDGYKELGRRYYQLVSRDLYDENVAAAESPDIKYALFTGTNELTIHIKQADALTWESGVEDYFKFEGGTAIITSCSTTSNLIKLQFTGDTTGITGITCLDQSIITSPNVINNEGHGLVSFYNVPISDGIAVALKTMLKGAYTSGTNMETDLTTLLPLSEPYTNIGYVHTGGGGNELIDASVLSVTGDNAIVDWVLVELRDSATPSTIIASRSALLQADGDIVDIDGISNVSFPVSANDYYIAVKHRNHLGVMTSTSVSFN